MLQPKKKDFNLQKLLKPTDVTRQTLPSNLDMILQWIFANVGYRDTDT